MFQFEHPLVAVLFLVPPVIYFLFNSTATDKAGLPTINNPNIKWFSRAFGKRGDFSARTGQFNYLLYAVWALLVVALMHPQNITKISKQQVEGYDIILAVDLSRSMSATDMTDKYGDENRLDIIKKVAREFITSRQGDRAGIVLFGQNAYLQSPLTGDVAAAAKMLDMAEIGIAGDATAIGDALALSIKTLSTRPENSRVIILLTDGANTAGSIDPYEAANLAKNLEIKIHTLAVGKTGIVPVILPNGEKIFARMEVDEELLNEIARITGGTSNKAGDRVALEKVYKKINEMEKSKSEVKEVIIREQLYIYPLSIALLILLLRVLYNYRWRRFLLGE